MRNATRDSPLIPLALIVVGLVISLDALSVFWSQMERRDFGAFYASGRAWNQAADVYSAGRTDLPNLNPPSMVALVFAPLARLPLPMAGILWQCLGVAALAFAVLRGWRELAVDFETVVTALGALLVTVAARYVWLEGQITWLLMVPSTLAWIAYRRKAPIAAGVWLGLIVAVKPFFAVTAIALGIPVALTTVAVAAAITAVGVLVTSLTPWQQWLALGSGISVTWPSSASLWTLGTRLVGATPHDVVAWTSLPLVVAVCTFVVALAGIAAAFAQDDRDARWTIAIGLALLVSPLGWIYYMPLAWGAVLALWLERQRTLLLSIALVLCCIPMHVNFWAIEHGRVAGATLGASFTWAVLLMLIAAQAPTMRRSVQSRRPNPESPRATST
jgi:alpha-1,2-mannosyltransferase/arabinofuranan 3-O-arabinosyltransferase